MEDDGRYLITQRRPTAVLPMMWEFPGGKVEQGETDAEALDRELLHRLGVRIQVGKLISFVTHPYEHYVVDLFLYECRIVHGVARAARRHGVRVGDVGGVRPLPVHARGRSVDDQAARREVAHGFTSGAAPVHTSGVPIPASAANVQPGPLRYSSSAALSSADRVVPNCAPSWPTLELPGCEVS